MAGRDLPAFHPRRTSSANVVDVKSKLYCSDDEPDNVSSDVLSKEIAVIARRKDLPRLR